MKLGLVAPVPPPYGGISNWVRMVSTYINDGKIKEIELTCINSAPIIRKTEGRNLWNRIIDSGFQMITILFQVRKKLKAGEIDLLHVTTSGQLALIRDLAILSAASKEGVPSVLHIRFGRVPEIAGRNTIEWKLMKRVLRLSTNVMVLDKDTEKVIHAVLNKKKVIRIPNPIEINHGYRHESIERQVVIFVGWVVKEKGIEELLHAWQNICNNNPEWLLKIVGPIHPNYHDKLKREYSLKNVIIEGEKTHDDTMELLADSSIFVLPSYTEGFPNTILEAMSMKKAIIATQVGAIPDMLDKECGICISERSVEELQESLEKLIVSSELRNRLGRNAYARVLEQYSLDAIMKQYKAVWTDLSEKYKR